MTIIQMFNRRTQGDWDSAVGPILATYINAAKKLPQCFQISHVWFIYVINRTCVFKNSEYKE